MQHCIGFPNGSADKESACNSGDTGDVGSIPGLERELGEGNGNSLQYLCLKNPMNRGWQATVHGSQRSGMTEQLKHTHTHTHTHTQLIYNIVLVSGVQQNDLVIHIYLLFF